MVVGAGVVGIAVARELQLSGQSVVLIEQHRLYGSETSSRSSEVIHAGIYYPPGSLKAQLCVRGKQLLYDYCASRNVKHKQIGKFIVAVTSDEVAVLEGYIETAYQNGVTDIKWRDGAFVRSLEPAIVSHAAIWSPSTGIIDSHGLMTALLGDFQTAGGLYVPNSKFQSATPVKGGFKIELAEEEDTIAVKNMVNAAGLHATQVAQNVQDLDPAAIPKAYYAIGHYYTLVGKAPFRHLIYPVAQKGGLGVHVTLDLTGAARFGPDVRWLDRIDYSFDDTRKAEFLAAIEKYFPSIRQREIEPAYTGIRPKITGPGMADADFKIQAFDFNGAKLICLFGIESPGITSSLAIAERTRALYESSAAGDGR
jgi:L-2-hydroxyglutarate oxidase LhgO